MPVVHVNADEAGACVAAVRMAVAYRAAFGKDFLIDLVATPATGTTRRTSRRSQLP
jgi:2-oxoglutarate dehydrogenase complex dehydrogenase (E1) component-like enzyme